MKERVYRFDNLKAILMLLVIITHSIVPYQMEGVSWVRYLWVLTMSFTMPAFMMVSGYWFKQKDIKSVLKRFLYPCILFSVVNYVIGNKYGAYPNGIHIYKAGYAMWFLWVLTVYYLITPPHIEFF